MSFLQDKTIGYDGTSADFRKACLIELKTARHKGWLSAKNLSPKEIAQEAASFQRYSDPKGLVDGPEQVVSNMADILGKEFPNLGKLMRPNLRASSRRQLWISRIKSPANGRHALPNWPSGR
jgi:hypothetical protein